MKQEDSGLKETDVNAVEASKQKCVQLVRSAKAMLAATNFCHSQHTKRFSQFPQLDISSREIEQWEQDVGSEQYRFGGVMKHRIHEALTAITRAKSPPSSNSGNEKSLEEKDA